MVFPERQDWLLRFIAGDPGDEPWIDRIRLMKGMFLFQRRPTAPGEINYAFKPYDYGPFTPDVYRDVEALSDEGFVISSSEHAYRATEFGKEYLGSLSFPGALEHELLSIREEVISLSFRELLRKVYSEHPESASRSVAKDIIGDISRRPFMRRGHRTGL